MSSKILHRIGHGLFCSWRKALGQGTTTAIDMAMCFTLLDLLLHPMGPWSIRPVVLTAACVGLFSRQVRTTAALWLVLAILAASRLYDTWPMADNHDYVLSYWLLAVGLALLSPRPDEVLAVSSRYLLVSVFGLAVLWKGVLTTEFIDGTFFRFTFQTDGRFESLVHTLGGISPEQLELNRAYLLNPQPEGAVLLEAPAYWEPRAFRTLVTLFKWATLAIETLIALLFALPRHRIVRTLGHLALLAFCVFTYAIAPVAGFGWLILVMGMAQLSGDSRFRYAYAACFFLLVFYRENEWRQLVRDTLSALS